MAGVIDTNLLLYGANESAEEHSRALDFLTEAGESSEQWYLPEGVLFEGSRLPGLSRDPRREPPSASSGLAD